ncbi:MAG: molybdate ABC transporter substrate-binding protein [Cellvibrionaceae bacterium]
MRFKPFVLMSLFMFPVVSFSGEITVAVASNFINPMKVIAKEFEAETGHTVKLVFGSSGKIYSQIRHGAPFDVFLSADQDKPEKLVISGHAVEGTRFTYATGRLVLWAMNADQYGIMQNTPEELASNIFQSVIEVGDYKFLSMANPKLAPYGKAAQEVVEALTKGELDTAKIVQGENIAQAFQFVYSGNADLGFVALSQVAKNNVIDVGFGWIVPETLHSPIHQDAVLIKQKDMSEVSQQFLDYLKKDSTKKIIRNFGYSFIH